MIEIGKLNELEVVRKTDLGYMLSDQVSEILMHYKQANGELEIGQKVEIYVYTDKQDRKTGTMKQPALLFDHPGFVKVVEVMTGVGVFVDNQTPKDLLVSKDYLPYDEKRWPEVGDYLFCGLKMKKDTLVAKPLNRFDVIDLKKNHRYADQEQTEAYVMHIALKGIGLITLEGMYVFVPNTQLRQEYRMGQKVVVTITKMLDQEAYGTLNEHKELLMKDDQELILNYLKSHQGMMNLTAKSSAEEVEKLLKMSRKAFKRAYGALYKEQLIYFDDKKTYLTKL